jgi:hypothetical protein
MANIIYSSGAGVSFSPSGNRIPITFSSESTKLLTLTDTSFNINVPIVKGTYDTSSNQIGGSTTNYNGITSAGTTGGIILNPTITIPSTGVWYIQGSLFVTYSATTAGNDSFTSIWTQINTSMMATSGTVPDTNYYPSWNLDQNNVRATTYSANSGVNTNYSTTQIFPISLVISLSSVPSNIYVSARITKSTANNCTMRIITNAFRIG